MACSGRIRRKDKPNSWFFQYADDLFDELLHVACQRVIGHPHQCQKSLCGRLDALSLPKKNECSSSNTLKRRNIPLQNLSLIARSRWIDRSGSWCRMAINIFLFMWSHETIRLRLSCCNVLCS